MKKLIIYSFIGSLILINLYINSDADVVKGEEEKVVQIVNNLHKMNAEMNEWTIFTKDDPKSLKSLKEFRETLVKFKNDNPNYIWDEDEHGDHHIKLTGMRKNNDIENERITLSVYKVGNIYQMLKTYSFKSQVWSEDRFNQIVYKINTQKQWYFTIKSKSKLTQKDLSKEAKKMILDLSASQVESLVEKDFVSISAYRDEWGNYIPSNNGKKINLQIGIRRNSDSPLVDLTIGSPIITEEY